MTGSTMSNTVERKQVEVAPSCVTEEPCPPSTPTESCESVCERIKARAYEIFLARNGGPGDPVSDWLQAEREINESGAGCASVEIEAKVQARGERLLASGE